MNNNFDSLIDLLKTEERYVAEDGDLLKAKVYQDAMMMEESLLNLLLSQEETKEAFFTEVGGTLVFDKYEFAWLINSKEFLPDSYTAYTNKIGLATNRKFISQTDDIVLDFPYKDAVLAGGQDKEDQKRDEIMFHSILAREQIMNMLTPKVFTNAKRYTAVGDEDLEGKFIPETIKVKEELATEFKEDDNLIIKGNNLIALSSLLERYEGKVKLIYIDPPYNTGSDSFNYNDRFNHSTWLTFMKNRLKIAKKLLRMDGSIFVQIDYNEDSYLKVLMDEIFGEDNFRNKIVWKRRGGSANPAKQLNNVVDYLLWYAKNLESMDYQQVYSIDDENTKKYIEQRFTFVDENGRRYMKSPIQSPNYRENLIYDYKGYKTPKKGYSISKEVMKKWDEEGRLDFPDSKDKNINRKIFLDEYQGQPINSLWTDIYVINPMSNERIEFGSGQKPEALIRRILEMVTSENDLILDFFMGSATTQAVAMKMKRRFIGVEQMDYIHTVSVPRLHKVMEGEQGGISQDVDWQGGGSFVYCELKEDGQTLIDAIQASDENTISEIKNYIYQDERIVPYHTAQELKSVDNEFEHLDINDKKKVLIELVDKNKLYVNYSSIDDEDYDVSDEDKSFTHSFYEVAK
jgi:adenine-specific DNA-methyltransferase